MHSDLFHSEQAAAHVLSLPMYPELEDNQVARVAETLHDLLRDDTR